MSRFDDVFITRAEWGARAPKNVDTTFAQGGGIVVHHTAVFTGDHKHYPDCYASMRGHQRYHMDTKGWNDIAYNFVICPDGFIFEGRGWNAQNAANTPVNDETVSVAFDGDGRRQTVGLAAIASFNDVVEEAVKRNWAPIVRGHDEANGVERDTTCPSPQIEKLIATGLIKVRTPVLPDPVTPPATPYDKVHIVRQGNTASVYKLQYWASQRLSSTRFKELAGVAFEESAKVGVDATVVYAIMAHETNFGKFTGVVPFTYHNWGGIKTATGGGNFDVSAHATFPSDRVGVRAVAQHLALYAGLYVPSDEVVDPRHFESVRGKVAIIPDAAWTWSSTGQAWSESVYAKVQEILGVKT